MNQWEGLDIEGEGIYDTGEDVLELYSFDVVSLMSHLYRILASNNCSLPGQSVLRLRHAHRYGGRFQGAGLSRAVAQDAQKID